MMGGAQKSEATMLVLGNMQAMGIGVEQNEELAREYLTGHEWPPGSECRLADEFSRDDPRVALEMGVAP
jgi:hypothetical protein